MLYGWLCGGLAAYYNPTVVYLTPEGKEVEVMFISTYENSSGTLWPDCQSVGRVTKFVRKGKPAQRGQHGR